MIGGVCEVVAERSHKGSGCGGFQEVSAIHANLLPIESNLAKRGLQEKWSVTQRNKRAKARTLRLDSSFVHGIQTELPEVQRPYQFNLIAN
jgi:hypothetical protein